MSALANGLSLALALQAGGARKCRHGALAAPHAPLQSSVE